MLLIHCCKNAVVTIVALKVSDFILFRGREIERERERERETERERERDVSLGERRSERE